MLLSVQSASSPSMSLPAHKASANEADGEFGPGLAQLPPDLIEQQQSSDVAFGGGHLSVASADAAAVKDLLPLLQHHPLQQQQQQHDIKPAVNDLQCE